MKVRTNILLVLFLSCIGTTVFGQQIQQFTQYQWSGISFNPAFTGKGNYFNALAVHRTQWTGIQDAPRTYFMSLDAPSRSKKMGFGGMLYTDVAGPTRRFGVQGAYAYHIQTSEKTKFSLGLTFGITQMTIDGSQITLREEGDLTLTDQVASETKPDANFGALWYSDKFYVGVSANQILNNQLDMFPGDGDGNLAVHYYLTGAYRFDLGEKLQVEPSTLVKYVDPLPVQVDLSARFIYDGNLWLGGTYRSDDAAAVFAGYQIMNYLTIGYSYDITTSKLKKYADGTHEIFIQFKFGKAQMMDRNEN